MTETIRVLIADDHPLILRGIRGMLGAADDIALVGEASRGDEVQRLCQELLPDVLVLDLQMPGATATETVTFVRAQCPQTQVVILTAYDDDIYVRRMFAEGVAGYVLKDEIADGIVTAIRTVMQGGTWLSRRVLERWAMREFPRETSIVELDPTGIHRDASPISLTTAPLTRQQRTVLRLVEHALTNDEIAEQLCISQKTVKKHLEDIYQRLQVHNRMAAARVARERHYLD